MFKKHFAEFIWVALLTYWLLAILPPFLYKANLDPLANTIHSVYRVFCHQRVERTPFLLGEKGFIKFYSIEELQLSGVIPENNPNVPSVVSDTIFGYPYVGNDYVGYKTALCIRDLGIYTALLITGAIYLIYVKRNKKIPKFKWSLIILLMIPMSVDGMFQLIAEIFEFSFVPDVYFDSYWKRIITGALFGIGFALFIFSNLKESTNLGYNNDDDE